MTAHTSRSHTSTWVGILAGVLLLGLLAAFAIGLPKLDDGAGDEAAPEVEITLPDELPGGFRAADLEESFADTQYADQAAVIAQQQADQTAYGNTVLGDVLDHPAATRSYLAPEDQAVFVQVFTSDGGAFAPGVMSDPASSQGGGGVTMAKVGDGVCILSYGQSTDGTVGDPVQSQCQVSSGGFTAQVQAGGVAAEDLVALADAVLADVTGTDADQDQ